MSVNNILDLPDLALHRICEFITCPFDLINFGKTCKRIFQVTLSESLWSGLSFYWFKGIFGFLEETEYYSSTRLWFLKIIEIYSSKTSNTKRECKFLNGEQWLRNDSDKLCFLYNMLRLHYQQIIPDHPVALPQEWFYDIGTFVREKPCIDFTQTDLENADNVIYELVCLSQAADRDHRRRKQPYKSLKSYIKVISTSSDWVNDLFPSGFCGSICPLLMYPIKDPGIHEFSMCISYVLGKYLRLPQNISKLSIVNLIQTIKSFQSFLTYHVHINLPSLENKYGKLTFRDVIFFMIQERIFESFDYEEFFSYNDLRINFRDLIADVSNYLRQFDTLDVPAELFRENVRKAIISEIETVLFPAENKSEVIRVNLTDSDSIGGDNAYQEMTSAAFTSNHGVLVVWQWLGKIRF